MNRQTCWTKFRDKKAERPLVGGDLSLTTQSILVVAWGWVVGETEGIPKLTRRLDLHNSRFVLNYLKQRLFYDHRQW